jgi:hypothetical protein
MVNIMAKMVTIKCACGCGKEREVRQADVNRGWGKYFNKSHKAKHQERRTGQYAAYMRRRAQVDEFGFYKEGCEQVSMESGIFGHGQE